MDVLNDKTIKQQLGAFYTTNVNVLLERYKSFIKNKHVVDLYCGDGHLLEWALKNGAASAFGYDINPSTNANKIQDTLNNPPQNHIQNHFLILNPPYLYTSKNKSKTKTNDIKDLYKVSIKTVIENMNENTEGIFIIPMNFFCDKDYEFRNFVFNNLLITNEKNWINQSFDDTLIKVSTFYFKKGKTTELFGLKIRNGHLCYDWDKKKNTRKLKRLVEKDKESNHSNYSITLNCIINDSQDFNEIKKIGEVVNKDNFYYGKISDRNKLTLNLVGYTKSELEKILQIFYEKLFFYNKKFKHLNLTNFFQIHPQKIRKRITYKEIYSLMSEAIDEYNKKEVLDEW